jgi:hypothetical protein
MNANAHWMYRTTFATAYVNVVLRHYQSPFFQSTMAYRRGVVNISGTRVAGKALIEFPRPKLCCGAGRILQASLHPLHLAILSGT